MNDQEIQFSQAVQGVFSTPLGAWLLTELQKRTARPFSPDPYRTAYNCGAQDLVALMTEILKEN
jgi:hypothetical protein